MLGRVAVIRPFTLTHSWPTRPRVRGCIKGHWVVWAEEMASGGENLPNSWPVKSKLAARPSLHFKGEIKTRLSVRAGPSQKGGDACNHGNVQTLAFFSLPFSSPVAYFQTPLLHSYILGRSVIRRWRHRVSPCENPKGWGASIRENTGKKSH